MSLALANSENKLITPDKLKRGQIAIIRECPTKDYIGEIVIRVSAGLVNLKDGCTWTNVPGDSDYKVEILPNGTSLTILDNE